MKANIIEKLLLLNLEGRKWIRIQPPFLESESDQNYLNRIRPKKPNPDPTSTTGSRSYQNAGFGSYRNNRIRILPVQPDLGPTKANGSGFNKNNRFWILTETGSEFNKNNRFRILPKQPDSTRSIHSGFDQYNRIKF